MKRNTLFFVVVLTLTSGCQPEDPVFDGAYRKGRNSGNPEAFPPKTYSQILREVNDHFTFRGHPIHPDLVKEFECWISDLNPVTLAVDVSAAFDSNEYAEEPFSSDGRIWVKTDEGLYAYQHITASNGVHVLKTSEGSELWVRFEIEKSQYPDGSSYDQLIMRLVRAK